MNIRKIIWCAFHYRIYKANKDLTALIRKCIWLIENYPNVKVCIFEHDIRIDTSSTSIELWNANKFYGWLSSGHVNGRKFDEIMPSLSAMYDFKECLKKHGHNIYAKDKPKEPPTKTIDISDISC